MNKLHINNPLVSVVIPTYNRAYCIMRAIESIINQSYKNIEIIIVDNNSTDETETIINQIKSDIKILFYKIKNNGIIAKSRNFGINKSLGKYIAFLDSDDWWSKKKIEYSVKYLEEGSDLVYHDLYRVHKRKNYFKKLWKIRTRKLKKPVFKDLLIYGNAINNSSVVLRSDFIKNINGFSENPKLISSEDYETWIRYSKITDRFFRINKTLGSYWQGGGNTSNLNLTLESMNQILILYNEDINKFSKNGSVGFNYTVSRSYYGVSDFQKAIKFSSKIIVKKVPLLLCIKALITICLSIFYYSVYLIKTKIF